MKTSVIIPCYNLGNYVLDAINSARTQTTAVDEIIVINDASTDNTADILARFENEDNVRVIHNESNLGHIETFNKAIRTSTGEYFIVLSADDYMDPTFIEKHHDVAKNQPGCAIYYSDFVVFGSRAQLFAVKNNIPEEDGRYILRFPDPTDEALANIRTRNMLHGSSLTSREWFDNLNGYQVSEYPEDLDFGIRVLEAGAKVAHVPFPLLHYRQHSTSQTQSQRLTQESIANLTERIEMLQDVIKSLENEITIREDRIQLLAPRVESAEIIAQKLGYKNLEQLRQQQKDKPLQYKLLSIYMAMSRATMFVYSQIRRPRNPAKK